MKQVLGVDIGGVIIDRANDGTDTSFFTDNFLQTTAVKDVFEALRLLARGDFKEDGVFLVSKCGPKVQAKTLEWLEYHNFYARTGIRRDNVYFCRARHEKAGICQELGITHFIDDRLEVLGNLTTVNKLYLFQPRPDEVRKFARFLNRVKRVESWCEILREV